MSTTPAPAITLGGELTVGRIGYGAMQLTGKQVWGDYPDREGGIAVLRAAAAVTAHYNLSARTGADLLRAAEQDAIAFSPWHPVTLTEGPDTAQVMAVVEQIAARPGVTARQLALAWHLHRSPVTLPIPGTTSIAHLKDNLAAAHITLSADEVTALTSLAPEA